ncbi:MAG: NAD(P)/FAD-dependent oxidoreductase [Coriobacteriaceae bacterium]|nr:NAD(P)/FAD-dependent oxidoreductase [Coriobacteriaceae bacterium]
MSKEYDAIVVGGGIAGLTAAAFLCRYGIRTLLCEKADHTGGLVTTFWHHGFAFDAGIRAFEDSGIIFPMLRSLNIELQVEKNPVSIGIESCWIRLDSRASLNDYAEMLSEIFPQNRRDIAAICAEIEKVMGYMDVIYGIDNPLFRDDMRDSEYLLKTLLPWLLKYQVNISKASRLRAPVVEHLRRFTDNDALIALITQHFFKGTPTSFALSYFSLYLDYSYPKGGMGALAQKLDEYILSSGGEIVTHTTINSIDPVIHEISTANGDTYHYQHLIWAADQTELYSSLRSDQTAAIEKQRHLVSHSEGGDSVLSLYVGSTLSSDFFREICGAHAFYTPSTKGLLSLADSQTILNRDEISLMDWLGKYLDTTTYELSCPALRDVSLAPEGKTGIIISTLMDYRFVKHLAERGEYQTFKRFCSERVIRILNDTIFPKLADNLEFVICSTPLTIERETGNKQGAITGWAFTNDVLPAETRFKKIQESVKTPIVDVYQCGQWTFSPSGLPVSILTGKLAADAIKRTLKD